MTNKYSSFLKGLNIIIDFTLLNLSFYIGYVILNNKWDMEIGPSHNLTHVILMNLIWYLSSRICHLYTDVFIREAVPSFKSMLRSLIFYGLLMVFIQKNILYLPYDSTLLVISFTFFTTTIIIWKLIFLLQRRPHKNSLTEFKPIVIVGTGRNGLDLYHYFSNNAYLGYKVMGFFNHEGDGSSVKNNINVIGKIDDCIEFVRKKNIGEIFCALPDKDFEYINKLMHDADKHLIRFKLVPDVKDYFKKNVMVQLYGHLPVLSPRMEPLESKGHQILKRSFDIIFSLFVIVFILSWVVPFLALLIKLESRGPVFFRQIRSGKDNKPFYCLKFRSMTVNKDANSVQATKNDKRITKIGRFLRKTSLDELPQFINVLIGNMSVVGPRPHMIKHTKEYSAIIDKFMVRHFLTPGITGWAQVNGLRGETKTHKDMKKRVEADIWYLENWSILLDLKIIFMTIYNVFAGDKKAY
ncbi:undecaprenyl-phosphate glucose phosphotransferase [Solitalea sp. MAHUQ-68]|uniref:Undecaprenyl-phosphate glucose phosphotransferase n=1 Tax=Solitalea agri TaxID=2953739 RepID=A0A9X2JC37_9SPHI|nr:undecaprenyl-phosphate glucose phosphotransferase [Solitalea agri]MCO4292104.1 undecaprenyl-phosphate glucose phosphotransferase [Solitalea agri]